MDNKNNSKMKVLMQLREMVDQMIDEDFKSDKMPKLMAVKVTKVEPLKKEISIDSEASPAEEIPSLSDAIKSATESEANPMEPEEICPICGKSPCECESMEEIPQESDSVQKLKKLLRK